MTGLTVKEKDLRMQEGTQGEVSNFATPSIEESSTTVVNTPVERTFKQSEVNELIGRAKNEAVERFKRDPSRSASQAQQHDHHAQSIQNQFLSHDEVRRLAAEETQRLRQEWSEESQRNAKQQDANRIASEFFQKIDSGKAKYDDFDTVTQDVNFGNIANTVALATQFDNTADIMYELSKNPTKIGSLESLMLIDPKLAMVEMRRLSNSLKSNEEAGKFNSPNEPLSQMRPTKAGAEKSGPLTAADYRRRYKV